MADRSPGDEELSLLAELTIVVTDDSAGEQPTLLAELIIRTEYELVIEKPSPAAALTVKIEPYPPWDGL
jgi:hypothetical protein